jgi:uncharacterized membrane protein YciS (DUF1049 family)
MRFIYFLLLLLFIAAVVVFAIQNKDPVAIKYLDRSDSYPMAGIVGVVYVLGMLTGWTIVGILRRSLRRISERQ